MQLSYPKGHKPRYENFQLDGLLDETLREGAERCLFSVDNFRRLELIENILDSGVRDIKRLKVLYWNTQNNKAITSR